jgi:hypothetical protein
MTYRRSGLYDFVREESFSLSENIDEREEHSVFLVSFFFKKKKKKLEGIFLIFDY